VQTMPDNALHPCAARLYYFLMSQNLDYKMFTMRY